MLDTSDPAVIAFYRQLGTALGFNTAHCNVSPYAANGDFAIALAAAGTNADKYFDIANPAFGPIDGPTQMPTYGSKTLLVGNLFLTTYASPVAGGASVTFNQFLATGPASATVNWFVRKRTGIATDDTPFVNGFDSTIAPPLVKVGFSDQYYNTVFSFLRMTAAQINAGNVGVVCEYIFNGIRVDF